MLATDVQSADAQPAPAPAVRRIPTEEQLDQARAHFKAAEAAKARHEYQTAAIEYLAAYELFQEPEFFYNVAEVHRLAGDEPNALVYYEKYLQFDPNGRGAAKARTHAAELRRSIAAKQDALARASAEEENRKAKETRRKADEEARSKAVILPERREDRGRSLRIAGIATGVGVISFGVGVFFGLQMQRIENELSDTAVFDPSRYADGEAAERNMFLLTGAGVAGIVAGGVLYYLGHRAARTAETGAAAVTFTPVVGPSQVTFTAAGSF